jgi:hypothetical protein
VLQGVIQEVEAKLFDAAKMRDFASSYKRHTIRRFIRPKQALARGHSGLPLSERIRDTPLDYFQVYCRMVIPQIEVRMEERLLNVFLR